MPGILRHACPLWSTGSRACSGHPCGLTNPSLGDTECTSHCCVHWRGLQLDQAGGMQALVGTRSSQLLHIQLPTSSDRQGDQLPSGVLLSRHSLGNELPTSIVPLTGGSRALKLAAHAVSVVAETERAA